MPKFDQYRSRYENFVMERTDDGILTLRLHTQGGPLVWGARPNHDIGMALNDIARDRENNVLILTGTGDQFISKIDYRPLESPKRTFPVEYTASSGGMRDLDALFALHIPVIAAVNGPARVHSELAVLSDIVLASPNALFQDLPHFPSGLVPGDGINATWQLLLGPNRARYFLWTGQEIHADEALRLGVINEVVPLEALLARAYELARLLMKQPKLVRKFTRQLLIRNIKAAHFAEAELGGVLELTAWGYSGPPADVVPGD